MKFVYFALFVTLSPALSMASQLVLNASEADSNVFEIIRSEGVDAEKPIGKTPYTVTQFDSNADHLYKIEKNGFSPVYLPFLRATKGDVTIKVSLRSHQDWIPEDAAKRASAIAEQQIEEILTVQLLLDQKKLSEALAKSEDLKRSYPSSTGVQLVYANALLMNGQFDKATTLYTALIAELPESKVALKSSLQTLVQKLNRGKR